jgi:CPA1 family monovalent cation:H+ antiporter
MATALISSLALIVLDELGALAVSSRVRDLVGQLDFGNTLLHGMLGLLLFAGALHIDLDDLGEEKAAVGLLALGGTVISTAVVGAAMFAGLAALGLPVRWIDALLFGALISPTDPIAVLGMLKSAGAPRRLETRIAGESLFNDGVGVVVFTVLLAVERGHGAAWTDAALLFLREAVGGALFGGVTGYAALRLLRSIDDSSVEVLITLALVVGGYTAAELLHVSAPIGAVVAGLVIGNHGAPAMSAATKLHIDVFWKLVDDILNAVLFLMIGLIVFVIPVSGGAAATSVLAIAVVLGGRWLAVTACTLTVPAIHRAIPHSVKLLTWGGLRGGLSIAMALALPAIPGRERFVVMTYAVVAFSILVQGLSFGPLLRRLGVGASR